MGNIGYSVTPNYLKDFVNSWHIDAEYVTKGENKVRFNPFKEKREADREWVLNLFNHDVDYIVDRIVQTRKEKLSDLETVQNTLKQGELITGKEAAEMGLVDEATTPHEFFAKLFEGKVYTMGPPKPTGL